MAIYYYVTTLHGNNLNLEGRKGWDKEVLLVTVLLSLYPHSVDTAALFTTSDTTADRNKSYCNCSVATCCKYKMECKWQ
jgi:hypothetical protein